MAPSTRGHNGSELASNPRRLRVAIDMSATQRPRTTGWERHLSQLATQLRTSHELDLRELRMARASQGRLSTLLAQQRWYWGGLRRATGLAHPELVHCAAFPPPPLPVPVVWTVHDDLIVGGHQQYARQGARVWVPLGRRALRHVAAVVTDTDACRSELIAAGAAPANVHVIRPAVAKVPSGEREPVVTDSCGRPAALPREFILCVGTLEPRKRLDVAAGAAALVGMPIVLVGRAADGARLPRALATAQVLVAGHLDDGQLGWLYDHASALISASAYEGFNYPLAEARLHGLPIVASDIAVHREVAPDAFFFELGSAEDAAQALGEALGAVSPQETGARDPATVVAEYTALYRTIATP